MTTCESSGKVIKAMGNLLHVAFDGDIKQGEVAFVRLGDKGAEGRGDRDRQRFCESAGL